MGMSSRLRKASVELAHSAPRFAYMPEANMGNPAPNRFLTKMTYIVSHFILKYTLRSRTYARQS